LDSTLATRPPSARIEDEFGPVSRLLAARYFESVRLPPEAESELRALSERGFVVHVMRTTAWVNYLYLAWALVKRGLPPLRAVVNLRPWFTRPWRNTAQRGDFDVRFTYARQQHGAGLIFLKQSALGRAEGRYHKADPFPALVALARRSERPVYLVPELFVWEKRPAKLMPSVLDRIFGSPEAPGFLHSVVAFWRNHHRAQFRVGEAIDLQRFLKENPQDSDAVLARKVRSSLYHHLARETRAVFGATPKPADRVIEETLRDRSFRKVLEDHAIQVKKRPEAVVREAERNLRAIAARFTPTMLAVSAPILTWVFNRIYDGMEVDEAGLERALKAAGRTPIVICPSHKSHVDYLVMHYVLWTRGYTPPLVAAGANLSFFPLGSLFRRAGAFFLRRSFKGDVIYTAAFKAYIKKLVFDGVHQEFFPEGGRSRTGKLLPPKLGMFTWEVDAVLEGAAKDLTFIPVAIDYEKVVESGSYSKELAGGDKKPEDIKALLSTPKVLASNYGRIYISFDEPVSLAALMRERGLSLERALNPDQKKNLVRALAHRVMYGINKAGTVTPHALVSAALLSHRRRGIGAREVGERISLLRQILQEEGGRQSEVLRDAPSGPTEPGPIQEAIRTFGSDGLVKLSEVKGDVIYAAVDERRAELSFYKNTLMNLVAPRSLVVNALLAAQVPAPASEVQERALFLSRLFKVEFIYRVGAGFDVIFAETVEKLVRMGLITHTGGILGLAAGPRVREKLEFIEDLLRDYLESYLLAALTLQDLAQEPLDKKAFVRAALDTGRAEFLSGRIVTAEALSRTPLENAVDSLLDQNILVEQDKKLKLGPGHTDPSAREAFIQQIRTFLVRPS